MLECRDLAKTYRTERGPVDAVRGVSLTLPAGGFAAVIGRSGSGKSSLLAMIGGLSRPSVGAVLLEGQDIWALSDDALAGFRNRRIGFVLQAAGLLASLRLLDNVALPALLQRHEPAAQVYERAEGLLAAMGLAGYPDAYPGEISAGEQRRAAIARALINRPALLLADEPTADLDEVSEAEIMAALTRVNREAGTTLLLVTHALALAEAADQVIHIANGALAA